MINNKRMLDIVHKSRRFILGSMQMNETPRDQIRAVQHANPIHYIEDMQHALFICDQIEEDFLPNGRRDKMNRWLGWLQKTLQIHGVLSLHEQKTVNAPPVPAPEQAIPGPIFLEYHYNKDSRLLECRIYSKQMISDVLNEDEAKLVAWESMELTLLEGLNQIARKE